MTTAQMLTFLIMPVGGLLSPVLVFSGFGHGTRTSRSRGSRVTATGGSNADAIRNRQVQIVFNTADGQKALSDSKSLVGAATLMQKVPYYTTLAGAAAVTQAIAALKAGSL